MKRSELIILSIVGLAVGAGGGWYAGQRGATPEPAATPTPTQSPIAAVTASPLVRPSETNERGYDELLRLAETERRGGKVSEAIATYGRAIAIDGRRGEARLQRGQLALQEGDFKTAEADLRAVLAADPGNRVAREALAHAVSASGRFDEALTIARGTTPETILPYLSAALQCSAGADAAACRSALETAAREGAPEADRRRARRVLDALRQFELGSDGVQAHRHAVIAEALANNGDYAAAERLAEQAAREDAAYRDAWIILGYARYGLRQYDAAIDALKRAQALDQKKAETAYYLGLCYLKTGQRREAIESLRRALDYGSSARLDIQKYLADASVDIEDYPSALTYYLQIVDEGVSKDINAYVRPMWIYIERTKEPQKAIELAKRAYSRFPDSAMASNLVGWAQLSYGNLAEAERFLREALQRDERLQAAHLNFGDLYVQQGRLSEAKQAYRRAYELDPVSTIGALAGNKFNSLP